MKPTGELTLFNEIWNEREHYKPMKKKCKFENCSKEFHPLSTLDKYCPQHRYEVKKAKSIAKSFKVQQKPKKPINKVSAKRAEQNKEYSKLRKQFLIDNPMCQIYPHLPATEVHHTYCGADRNKHFLDVDSWMAVSRAGHNAIHENVSESKKLGYLK